MEIYTRTGDGGRTDLPGGDRTEKDSARIEACGTVDELNAALGAVRAESLPEDVEATLEKIQHQFFRVGAQLAGQPSVAIVSGDVEAIEGEIDRRQAALPPLETFILPAGNRSAALLHVARTVCRRAERRLVALVRLDDGRRLGELLPYFNRLSDLLFVLARSVNAQAGRKDTAWEKDV